MESKRPIELWRYSGILLIATGVIHTVVGIALGGEYLWEILNDGLFDALGDDAHRNFAFWFLAMGIILIILGHVLHHYISREQKPVPRFIGYYFLGLSVVGCIIVPVSGFWLFIPQALIIIFAKRNDV